MEEHTTIAVDLSKNVFEGCQRLAPPAHSSSWPGATTPLQPKSVDTSAVVTSTPRFEHKSRNDDETALQTAGVQIRHVGPQTSAARLGLWGARLLVHTKYFIFGGGK